MPARSWMRFCHDACDDRCHDLEDGFSPRRGSFAVRKQQVPGPDERRSERVDVGIRRDAAEFPLDGEIGGDHDCGFRQDRDAGRSGFAQPNAQVITRDDEADNNQCDRAEHGRQGAGEVAGDRAGPRRAAQRCALTFHPGDAVEHKLGKEGIEVGEVPVQDALRAACLRGKRPAGQGTRPISEKDPLSSVEQLLARVADGYPRRQRRLLLRTPSIPGPGKWACAHYCGHMPTIGPDLAAVPDREPHRYREVAESFGSDPERYDRVRPSYPRAMVDRIVASSPGPDTLDVGIGTAIAARQFRAAGCKVLGVEVDPRMAEFARRSGFEVEVGAFEDWDATDRLFDLVVSGQTWHWVDSVAGAEKAAEALLPAGRIAVFWNAGRPPADVVEAFAAVYEQVMPDLPFKPWAKSALDGYSVLCDKAADGIRQTGAFCGPEQWRFDWERTYSREEWLDQLPTAGGHSRIPPEQLQELLEGTGVAIDALGGSFTMAYAAVVVTALRTGTAWGRAVP